MKIIHARRDERKQLKGGKAGDQGGEVARTDWYLHSKGWIILRATNPVRREKIAQCAEKLQRNSHVGYDQSQRAIAWNLFEAAHYNPEGIKKDCETDCSGLVRMCIAHAFGRDLVGNIRTDSMREALVKTGCFELIEDKETCNTPNFLKRGDILVTPVKGHTVVAVSNGGLSYNLDAPTLMSYGYNGSYKTKCDLNLRVGAGVDKEKIIVIPKEEFVTSNGCYSVVDGKVWLEVAYETDNKELFKGFCSKKYLED